MQQQWKDTKSTERKGLNVGGEVPLFSLISLISLLKCWWSSPLFSLSTTIIVQGDMNSEPTTLCAAQEQEKLPFVQLFRTTVCFIFTPLHFLISVYRLWQRMYVLGSFEPWTKFRLQGRFLRRYVMCVTAASAKSESQRKQAVKQNFDPLFPQGNRTTIGCSSVALPLWFQIESISTWNQYYVKFGLMKFSNQLA